MNDIETQTATSSGSVLARTDFTYVATGSTAGALKTTSRYKSSSVALTTTYSNHNEFGSPTMIYDETGMRTRIYLLLLITRRGGTCGRQTSCTASSQDWSRKRRGRSTRVALAS